MATKAAAILRDFVTLRTQLPTSDARWGPGTDWVDYAQVWASVLPMPTTTAGTESFVNQGVQSETGYNVILRYRTDVSPQDRIIYRGTTLEILSVVDPDGLRTTLAIQAKQYNSTEGS